MAEPRRVLHGRNRPARAARRRHVQNILTIESDNLRDGVLRPGDDAASVDFPDPFGPSLGRLDSTVVDARGWVSLRISDDTCVQVGDLKVPCLVLRAGCCYSCGGRLGLDRSDARRRPADDLDAVRGNRLQSERQRLTGPQIELGSV